MTRRHAPRFTKCLLAALSLLLAMPAVAQERPHNQVIVDAGLARPHGDLSRDYTETELGFGVGDGLEVGFSWRYHFSNTLSLAPAFHFVDYRDFKSTDAEIGSYEIEASSLRYTLELMMIQGEPRKPVRPFIALSGGLYRNRAVGYDKSLVEAFDQSVNSLGVAIRGGLRLGDLEVSGIYSLDRFATWRFFPTDQEQDYNWDSFTVRASWIIPFSDGPNR